MYNATPRIISPSHFASKGIYHKAFVFGLTSRLFGEQQRFPHPALMPLHMALLWMFCNTPLIPVSARTEILTLSDQKWCHGHFLFLKLDNRCSTTAEAIMSLNFFWKNAVVPLKCGILSSTKILQKMFLYCFLCSWDQFETLNVFFSKNHAETIWHVKVSKKK